MKVFLGGTCNESKWREAIIPNLKCDYFDPVVDDWDEKAQKRERYERESCDYVLYTITPKMTGVYSIAECIDDSNKKPNKTILCILKFDQDSKNNVISFDEGQMKSLMQVGEMVVRNGGKVFYYLSSVISYLNEQYANENEQQYN